MTDFNSNQFNVYGGQNAEYGQYSKNNPPQYTPTDPALVEFYGIKPEDSHTQSTVVAIGEVSITSSETIDDTTENILPDYYGTLKRDFVSMVGDLDLAELTVVEEERGTVAKADRFNLVPLVAARENIAWDKAPDFLIIVPEGVTTTADSYNTRPYLDTPHAIGLTYEDRLIAISSARVSPEGELTILQIQDQTTVRKTKVVGTPEGGEKTIINRAYYKTGLQQGMMWRETFVRCWEAVGDRLGVTNIMIQSNANNRWPIVRKGSEYDKVADSMGYSQLDPVTKNWVKPTHSDELS